MTEHGVSRFWRSSAPPVHVFVSAFSQNIPHIHICATPIAPGAVTWTFANILSDMSTASVYHWDWDCRVLLGLGDTPSQKEINRAHDALRAKVIESSALHGFDQTESQEARKLRCLQDAYEHLTFLVRTGQQLPPIPDWARHVHGIGPNRPPRIRTARVPPFVVRHGSRLGVARQGQQPGGGAVSPPPVTRSVSRRLPPRTTDRTPLPRKSTDKLSRKKSSRKLRRKSSKASSANSNTSLGSQFSDGSVSGFGETLEAIKDLMTTARNTVKKRQPKTLRYTALRSPRFRSEDLHQATAMNNHLLAVIEYFLTRIEQHQEIHTAVQTAVGYSCKLPWNLQISTWLTGMHSRGSNIASPALRHLANEAQASGAH